MEQQAWGSLIQGTAKHRATEPEAGKKTRWLLSEEAAKKGASRVRAQRLEKTKLLSEGAQQVVSELGSGLRRDCSSNIEVEGCQWRRRSPATLAHGCGWRGCDRFHGLGALWGTDCRDGVHTCGHGGLPEGRARAADRFGWAMALASRGPAAQGPLDIAQHGHQRGVHRAGGPHQATLSGHGIW